MVDPIRSDLVHIPATARARRAGDSAEHLGRFTLIERIGSGGMATVHRAIQEGEGGFARELVVKRILPQLANETQFVQMFIEEAKIGAHLNHPNIVQIYDLGQVHSHYFMAMEYVEGISFLRVLRCHGPGSPLPADLAAYIILQICHGLDYAHGLTLEDGRPLGIVHRDVSPANVMISQHGDVKLLDFGIAKAVGAIEREETRTGTLKGKLAYMSPEQVEGQPLTARSDIFVTGVLFWEALTGKRLFKGATDYQTLCNVVRAEVPPPSSIRPGELAAAFDEICLKALQARPEDRYESAEQMADEIESRILHDGPVGRSQLAELVARVKSMPHPNKTPPPPPQAVTAGERPIAVGDPGGPDEDLLEGLDLREDLVRPQPAVSSLESTRANRWIWTSVAFIGGALAATLLMIAILVLTGKL